MYDDNSGFSVYMCGHVTCSSELGTGCITRAEPRPHESICVSLHTENAGTGPNQVDRYIFNVLYI